MLLWADFFCQYMTWEIGRTVTNPEDSLAGDGFHELEMPLVVP